ncbi:MAG: YoaK family protein [Opitutae bacterium]
MLRDHVTPAWVYLGGLTLTTIAGVINAVGFLGVHHQALTHMTGTVTVLGMELAQANYGVAFHALAILTAFFLGCLISGVVISQGRLKLGRRYGLALSLESIALFLSVFFLRRGANAGDYLAALACGLQNAMVSSYSGSTMRTTHITGMITDLGIACGHFMRGATVDWFHFRLYGVLFLGFFAGGLFGAMGYNHFGYNTLLFPACLSGATGIGYTAIKLYERRRKAVHPAGP